MEYSHTFFSLYKDIKVAIKRLKIRYPIFIVKARDYDLVIGQLFLNFVKFYQKYKSDKIFDTIIHLHIYQTAIFYILALQNLAN